MMEKIFLNIFSPCFCIAALAGAVNTAEAQNCIEPSVASVSGLLPGMDKDALNNIDKYYSVGIVAGEDDSGDYGALIFHYAQYKNNNCARYG